MPVGVFLDLCRPALSALLTTLCVVSGAACRRAEPFHATIDPGPNAQQQLQLALVEARGGGVITLGGGRFELDSPVVIDAPGLLLRGRGMQETILDFSAVTTGSGDGILVTEDRFVLEDLAIESPPGDGIRLQKARNLVIRRVRVDWPGEPSPRNGGYGLYPIECQDLLFEDNVIRGAADSGIYVGQSRRALVQRNEVYESVAGIQIENSVDVVARKNDIHDNAAGVLAFSLPELPGETRRVQIAGNTIAGNNGPNFARPATRVAAIPAGSGVIVMAADEVEVADNHIAHHQTANLSIYSYAVLQQAHRNPRYDPYPETIWIHANRFEGGGDAPQGPLAQALARHIGLPFPDILFDGAVDPSKQVSGSLPPALRLYIDDNGDASFVDLDLEGLFSAGAPRISREVAEYAGAPPDFARPALPQHVAGP